MGIGDFLGKIGHFFSVVFHGIEDLVTDPDKRAKVEAAAAAVHDLAQYALPAAAMVARLTPTPTDDLIVATLERLDMKAGDILAETDPLKRGGLLLGLASEAIRTMLLDAVNKGQEGVTIGGRLLKTAEDVLAIGKALLDTAAQNAYGLVVHPPAD